MSLQLAAIHLLEHAAAMLQALARVDVLPDDCALAEVHFRTAIRHLSLEPLNLEDIHLARKAMAETHRCMKHLDRLDPSPVSGWADSVIRTYNAMHEVFEGLESFHQKIQLDPENPFPKQLRALLPASWWESQ